MIDPNKEQKFLNAVGGEGILDKIARHNIQQNTQKLANAINYKPLKYENKRKRENNDTWSKGKTMRQILEIPFEVAFALERIYGKQFWKDKKVLKKALENDEFLEQYLTVPKSTI